MNAESNLEKYIETVLQRGMERAEKLFAEIEIDETDQCLNKFKSYIEMVREAYFFSRALSTGDLSAEAEKLNFIAMPLKALQANLKHLVWQTQQVKAGDLSQRINFMGDFSDAFNSLIDALKTKRQLEIKVADNENRLRTITSVLGDGVIVTDKDGKISFCNPEACKLLKLKESMLIGVEFHKKIHIQHTNGKMLSSTERFLVNTIKERKAYRSDNESFTKSDGQIFPVSVSCTPIIENSVCSGAVLVFRDITEQKKYQESLEFINKILKIQSTTDHLTKLYNRQYFNEKLNQEINKVRRYKSFFSFVIFDIDKFKSINDTYGHNSGDCVLEDLAKIVGKTLRDTDILARWGGEEFAILLPMTDSTAAVKYAERIREIVEEYKFTIPRQVSCSFGVTQYIEDEKPENLINRADEALYEAKENGRNRVVCK